MMKFKSKEQKGVTVISLEGNVMGGPDATALNEKLHSLIDGKKIKVVVDLSNVDFINSSGLGLLIGGLTAMRKAGGELKLAGASKKIENLLEITKLHKVFDICRTAGDAVAAFHSA
jgi:anti-sigma B factor antagonist